MTLPKLWYIQGLDLLSGTGDLSSQLRERGRLERWGHRAEIAHREEPGELQVILSGGIDLRDGAFDVSTRLGPGDVYGETGVEPPSSALLRAYDDTIVAALGRKEFEELALESLGQLGTQFGLMRRRNLAVPVSALLYTTPRSRLARVLLHVVESYGDVSEDRGTLDLAPKPRNLAALSGLADRSVSDIFDAMQRDRVVEVGRSELVIPSLERMRELAIG